MCLSARFQSCPKVSHVTKIKRILRYLVGTTNHGLWIEKGSKFDLVGYCDANFIGDKVERKSTSDAYQFIVKSVVSWPSKKYIIITLSISTTACCS